MTLHFHRVKALGTRHAVTIATDDTKLYAIMREGNRVALEVRDRVAGDDDAVALRRPVIDFAYLPSNEAARDVAQFYSRVGDAFEGDRLSESKRLVYVEYSK
jgi:hypothetical protein